MVLSKKSTRPVHLQKVQMLFVFTVTTMQIYKKIGLGHTYCLNI